MEKEAKNIQELTFEITKDNLLHCLMHTATRENIAELRAENKADVLRLNDKLDTKASKADIAELKKHTSELRSELKTDMEKLDSKMDGLRKENNKYFRWIVGLMFGSFVGIAIMILKFPMLTH